MRALTMIGIGSFVAALMPPSPWAANGTSACNKLLTPQFLGTILVHADGKSEAKPDGESCIFSAEHGDDYNSITIALSDQVTQADWNRIIAANLPGGIPVQGVGDHAVRSKDATGLKAYKNGGRMCSVVFMPLGESPKLAGDALAKKFGAICNQLFALP